MKLELLGRLEVENRDKVELGNVVNCGLWLGFGVCGLGLGFVSPLRFVQRRIVSKDTHMSQVGGPDRPSFGWWF